GPQGDGGDAGDAAVHPDYVTKFNPTLGELPEGVAIVTDGGHPFVGFAPVGRIVDVNGATYADYATFSGPSNTFTLGIAPDPAINGTFYVAVAAVGASPTPQPGVYKVTAAGTITAVP